MRRALIGLLALALSGCGGSDPPRTQAPEAPQAAIAPARETADLPPLPDEMRPKVVEPVAGGETAVPAEAPVRDRTKPRPAKRQRPPAMPAGVGGNALSKATALPNGVALPPLEAPEEVKQIIEAGNVIARTPYLWGGGHGKWLDTGYDCSGSVSFALAAAGYLEGPLASGPLMSWGEPGPGKWVTIYANNGHVYMYVAGVRFDTSNSRVTGSRWSNTTRSNAGFVARHPAGL
jgi:hypothetical protein